MLHIDNFTQNNAYFIKKIKKICNKYYGKQEMEESEYDDWSTSWFAHLQHWRVMYKEKERISQV